jgi:hypothetical protein
MAFIRILQIVVGLGILPMMALGLMSSFSGGGMTPAYQDIGGKLLFWSPLAGVPALIISLLLWHFGQSVLAYIAILIPIAGWAYLLIRLRIETGFLTG